jgi:hypothetical protein
VNGQQIYNFGRNGSVSHRNWNETTGNWSQTSHEEYPNTTHPAWLKQKENYYNELQPYSWIAVPEEE